MAEQKKQTAQASKADAEPEKAVEPAKAARDAQREAAREAKEEQERAEAQAAKADAEPPEEVLTFDHARLIADAEKLVGRKASDVAGALHGVEKKNLTIEETQAAVDAWLVTPVNAED